MKKVFHIIFILTSIFTVSSCGYFENDEKPNNDEKQLRTIVELPDTIKQKIIEQDALMSELLNKVDTLTAELNSTKEYNAKLKEKVDEFKSPKNTWGWMSIGAFAISIIALLLSIFRKGLSEKEVNKIFKQNLDSSKRISELQDNVGLLLSQRKLSQTGRSYAPNTDTRLHQLESQMKQVITAINNMAKQPTSPEKPKVPAKAKESEYLRAGYAFINSGSYFTKILDSAQEGCVFSIKFGSATKGEFTIISLDKIKSRNGWQEIVEYTGSIEDANSFKVEELGICETSDKETWQVTKKLKIRLLK